MEKRLLRDTELGKAYGDILQKYQDKEYVRQVSSVEENTNEVWYLPHFPVIRPDKTTRKTCTVFDASAKTNDISLNDVTLQGPKLQNNLVTVLTRVRRDPVAIICDLQEMYLQIELEPHDKGVQRAASPWRTLGIGFCQTFCSDLA